MFFFKWVCIPNICIDKLHWKNSWSVCLLASKSQGRDKMAAIFADYIFKCNFLNETFWISNKISLKCVPQGLIDNKPSLVRIMGCRRTGDKPLAEPMMVSLPTHIHVTRPQWVNTLRPSDTYMCQWVITDSGNRLFGEKPLSEPLLIYCQSVAWEQISKRFCWKFIFI